MQRETRFSCLRSVPMQRGAHFFKRNCIPMQASLDFHPIGPIWWVWTGLSGLICLDRSVWTGLSGSGPSGSGLSGSGLSGSGLSGFRLSGSCLDLSNLFSRTLLPCTRVEAPPPHSYPHLRGVMYTTLTGHSQSSNTYLMSLHATLTC